MIDNEAIGTRPQLETLHVRAEQFALRSFRRNHRSWKGISDEAMMYLKSRPWRGNVRELENVIERGVLLADNGPLQVQHFQFDASLQFRFLPFLMIPFSLCSMDVFLRTT